MELTPSEVVRELDKYIIGQEKAKKAVAIALRNRYRRAKLPADIKEEVIPKNILMIGPTGVGKTEIARRLARLAGAPFIKVEATKYTEVGYVGRDVESMVRDLLEIAIRMVEKEKMKQYEERAEKLAIEKIVDMLLPSPQKRKPMVNPLSILLGGAQDAEHLQQEAPAQTEDLSAQRAKIKEDLLAGNLDNQYIEIEVEDNLPHMIEVFSASGLEELGVNFQDLFGGMFPKRKKKRKVTIKEAIKIQIQEEAKKFIDKDELRQEAIARVEQMGIIFIDELDKIVGADRTHGPDVSREGVQRDILPIVEGSTVVTKYGPVRTDHILFISAGAFHSSKPSDLIPELQGRFPIRVELDSLGKNEFLRILKEPKNALTKQYKALLATEGVELEFAEEALEEIAHLAAVVNEQTENIGARRLHTIMEKVLEDISFKAPELTDKRFTVTKEYVIEKLQDIVKSEDLSRYIL